MEAKLASFTMKEMSQFNLYWARQSLPVHTQELFCNAISYLQFTEL